MELEISRNKKNAFVLMLLTFCQLSVTLENNIIIKKACRKRITGKSFGVAKCKNV
jgi:hypothetical protein